MAVKGDKEQQERRRTYFWR